MPCRLSALVLCGIFGFFALAPAQQIAPPGEKVLTPEQEAGRQQWNEWFTKRQQLQAQAKQVYGAEITREKAGDCPSAQTTYDFNVCYSRQLEITDAALASYENIIRQLISAPPGQTPSTAGPAGPSLTPDQLRAEFERVELIWQNYRQTACTAAFHQFTGGTGGPSFQAECQLKLTRDHLQELNLIYGADLHL